MSNSDDDVEAVANYVTNYYFVDDKDEPVSFSILPIHWTASENLNVTEKHLYLHGTVESGLQKIYKQVIAWRLELSYTLPVVLVLSKDDSWIHLQKPRKSFEETIRTILITVHYLHFVKWHPETSGKSLWRHLQNVFSLYSVRPSEKDLLYHLPLIEAAAQQHETLSKSKFLSSFLKNYRRRKEEPDENMDASVGDKSDEDEKFDSVCAICDNGGDLTCCDGKCLRAFHATVDAGIDVRCESLGLSKARVEAKDFLCLNCQYEQHQCFACGKLGSSKKSFDAEVFHCNSGSCGYFYHARCVAKLLHPGNEAEAQCTEKKIAVGKSFTCPVHKCRFCKKEENKEVLALQFAVCRRCPKAYHRKCLPSGISFTASPDMSLVRGWDGLLPRNRALIYCFKHEIDATTMAPARNHIIFPNVDTVKKRSPSHPHTSQKKVVVKKRRLVSKLYSTTEVPADMQKKVEKAALTAVKDNDSTRMNEEQGCRQRTDSQKNIQINDTSKTSAEAMKKRPSDLQSSKRVVGKKNIVSKIHWMGVPVETQKQVEKVWTAVKHNGSTKRYEEQDSRQGIDSQKKVEKTVPIKTSKEAIDKRPPDFISSQKKVVAKKCVVSKVYSTRAPVETQKQVEMVSTAAKESDSTEEDGKHGSRQGIDSEQNRELKHPSEMQDRVSRVVDKSFAINECNELLEEGEIDPTLNNILVLLKPKKRAVACKKRETAMKCSPLKKKPSSSSHILDTDGEERLVDFMKEKPSLRSSEKVSGKQNVPSAHALSNKEKATPPRMVEESVETIRIASQKLEDCSVEVAEADCESETLNQIVEKLHWYLQNGDMIANFCQDADDYNVLMREKLEETGKRFSLKNYDIFQPKSDHNFQNRDWMNACRKELPTGSHLIIGLKLPLGVGAASVDKLIEDVLEFKPKLLILIVPWETKRLDEKEAYDLIWEDSVEIKNKSYLFGSVSLKQLERWSLRPVLLYLWSRCDWTSKHKAIALTHRHISQKQKDLTEKHYEAEVSEELMDEDGQKEECSESESESESGSGSGQLTEARAVASEEAETSSVPTYNVGDVCSGHEDSDSNEFNEKYDHKKKTISGHLVIQNNDSQSNDNVTSGNGRQDLCEQNDLPDETLDTASKKDSSEECELDDDCSYTSLNSLPQIGCVDIENSPHVANGAFDGSRSRTGFAPGPLIPYSQCTSSIGWLEE